MCENVFVNDENVSSMNQLQHQQGFDMLNKSKQEELEEKFREQKKMKDLQIDDYNPWGKPGAGAPNTDTLRKRKIFMDVLPPVILQPGGNEVTVFGRPGAGAPIRSKSGKPRHYRVEDPQLRFQFHGPVRKIVDVDLRYRIPCAEQKAYREELDELVKERQHLNVESRERNDIKDLQMGSEGGTFRRLGSHPQDNKELYEKFPYLDDAIRIEELTGGIELEPLLSIRKKRDQRYPLTSSDVTGVYEIKPHLSISENEYSKALNRQFNERERHKQEESDECKKKANKHFENWDQFWGRPGHGAPRPVKFKENLDYILYHLPILIRKNSDDTNVCSLEIPRQCPTPLSQLT